MNFVQIGREVEPRLKTNRHHKAVITGIKDNKFVVIMKQDRSYEIVRLNDVVLTDNVYSMEDLKSNSCAFFKTVEAPKKSSDFERFKSGLESRIVAEMIKEKGIKN